MGAGWKAVDNEVGEMDRAGLFKTLCYVGVSFSSMVYAGILESH